MRLPAPQLAARLAWLALAALAGALLWAGLELRPLMHEGAYWFFELLVKARPFYDPAYTRYADSLLQLPGALLLHSPWVSNGTATLLTSLAYSLHPIVSTALAMRILRRAGRDDLLALPLLGLAGATMPTISFAVSVVCVSLSFFWPGLAICLALPTPARGERARRPPVGQLLGYGACLLGLALSYEMSILLAALLTIACLLRRQWWMAAAAGLVTSWLAWRVLGPTTGYQGYFWDAVRQPLDAFQVFAIIVSAIILGAWLLGLGLARARAACVVIGVGLAIALVDLARELRAGHVYAGASHKARVWAIPVAAGIALGGIAIDQLRARRPGAPAALPAAALAAAAVALLAGAALDVRSTRTWTQATALIRERTTSPGCHELSYGDHGAVLADASISTWELARLSILLQGSRHPSSVLLARTAQDALTEDLCARLRRNHEIPATPFDVRFADVPRFDFTELLK